MSYRNTQRLITLAMILGAAAICRAEVLHEIPIANAGFEEVVDGVPAGWDRRTIGSPVDTTFDDTEKRNGSRSVKMTAAEMSRSAIVSSSFPVAAGETVHAAAWVKCEGVPPDEGKIMLVGEWTDAEGHREQASRIEIADVTNTEWQRVGGKIKVPAGAALMRLRMGFVYSHGTIWWDDVTASAEAALVVRCALPTARLSPVRASVPATIVNRSVERAKVTVRAKLGAADSDPIDVQLTGAIEQTVDLPLKFPKSAKQIPLRIGLSRGGEELFVEQRKMTIPPPIILTPIIPTHWAAEDGPPTLTGEVDLAVAQEKLDGATLEAKLVDASGKVYATWTSDKAHPPSDFTNAFALSSEALQLGEYRVIVALKPAKGEAMVAEQPFGVIERRQARITLNDAGYPVHDGTAIFPLGIFNGGARVKEMGEAGFTVQHAYNAVNVEPGERPNDQGAKDFLDNAQANGMKGLFLIPRGLAFNGDWDGVRRRIRMFKNHPALLAWDEEEGIARGDLSPEGLTKLISIIREEDPHHPIMVGDSRDIISRMTDRSNFFPTDHMDLGMWWWYPFPLDQGKDSGLEGEERSKEFELTPPSFLTLAKIKQPLWVGVQSYKKPPAWGRYPTPAEYRAQAYLAIIHGAKGLMWYGGSVTGGMYAKPEEAHWPELKKIVRELRDLSPALMGETMKSPTFEPIDAKLSVMLKRAPTGRIILLATNRAAKPVDVTLTLRDIAGGDVAVLSEERSVSLTNSELHDHFDPYAVHIYELRK